MNSHEAKYAVYFSEVLLLENLWQKNAYHAIWYEKFFALEHQTDYR